MTPTEHDAAVEAAARAMADAPWNVDSCLRTPSGEDPEDFREYWRGKARAALTATRAENAPVAATKADIDAAVLMAFDSGCESAQREVARLRAENAALREALKPFADCADELDGSEYVPRAPDGEWAKFRLLTDDYRRARAALDPQKGA